MNIENQVSLTILHSRISQTNTDLLNADSRRVVCIRYAFISQVLDYRSYEMDTMEKSEKIAL